MEIVRGRKIVRGKASGRLILYPMSFSFLGDVDMNTSQIISKEFINQNLFLKESIFLFTETKGSSGGCVVLMTLVRKKIAPAGIITIKAPDYNLTEGAILAGIPFISDVQVEFLTVAKMGDWIEMDTETGRVILKR